MPVLLEQKLSNRGFSAAIAWMDRPERRNASTYPMRNAETLIGFSLRTKPSLLPQWPQERRATYLLDQSIRNPLSADTDVWPACADKGLLTRAFVDFTDGPKNGWNLFANPKIGQIPEGTILLALSLDKSSASKQTALHKIEAPPKETENEVFSRFHHAGFDVTDQWLTSGLTNCGRTLQEAKALAEKFSGALNSHGLFASKRTADEFRVLCDSSVKEHSPFLVVSLWLSNKP